jgi:hypothetical protein
VNQSRKLEPYKKQTKNLCSLGRVVQCVFCCGYSHG